MTIDYKTALGQMRHRRLGDDAISIQKSELYESRGKHEATRYTLGAMQQVDPEYTRISFEEGDRVKVHLGESLSTNVSFRYQGSVPLNTHIRRGSDIDLLVIHGAFVTFDRIGIKAGTYTGVAFDPLTAMLSLRKECEQSLSTRYYAATVDVSGAKSIALSGGSFRRKIDVVPANWYDTKSYQEYSHEHFRDIQILDKHVPTRITNSPFRFKHEVETKDARTQGGTKKVIRMLKNIKNDSPRKIALTNYDITSLVWHMRDEKLNMSAFLELGLLAAAQEYLDYLYHNSGVAKELSTPDNSRKIIDSDEKLEGLKQLSHEVDTLAKTVYKELYPREDQAFFGDIRQRLLVERV